MWEDRFRAPTLESLRSESTRDIIPIFDEARQRLLTLPGFTESLGWHGIPWRWCLEYRQDEAPERPWAYLVPQPNRPKLALTLEMDQVTALPIKKLSRYVREGLLRSVEISGIRWVQWELGSKGQVDEIMAVVECKHTMCSPARA